MKECRNFLTRVLIKPQLPDIHALIISIMINILHLSGLILIEPETL